MVQESTGLSMPHKLVMQDRGMVKLSGVTDVISFHDKEIELETTQGALRFIGEELHVKSLTLEKGEVEIEGTVSEISYHESRKGISAGHIFGRLFQ